MPPHHLLAPWAFSPPQPSQHIQATVGPAAGVKPGLGPGGLRARSGWARIMPVQHWRGPLRVGRRRGAPQAREHRSHGNKTQSDRSRRRARRTVGRRCASSNAACPSICSPSSPSSARIPAALRAASTPSSTSRDNTTQIWQHIVDTIKGGDYLSDQPPIKSLCEEAPGVIRTFDRMGVTFSRTPRRHHGPALSSAA